jgi:hypothetical protein
MGLGPITEHIRIQKEAAKLRADSLRNRIMALDTFCGIARSQVQLGLMEHAKASIGKVRHALREIEYHLDEPHHIPSDAAGELKTLLASIKPKIERLGTLIDGPR